MTDHILMTPDDLHICREGYCWLCDGGLDYCKVCGLAARELDDQPECPGEKHAHKNRL